MNSRTVRRGGLAIMLVLGGLLSGCSQGPSADSSPAPATPESSTSAPASTQLTYPGEDGKTALELLLQADPSAKVQGEDAMAFVTSIQGVEAREDQGTFWALYLNGEMASVGAGSLITQTGDEITWKLQNF